MSSIRFLALVLVIPQLVSQIAQARPGELKPHATTPRLGALVRIDKPGAGDPPEDSDEATYRYDLFTGRDPAQATHEEKARRLTDINDRIRDHLLEMRPGELRWLWFDEQDGSACDHFGCSEGPVPYAARLELVSVVRHHAELPDGMHITAWPLLGVRRGELWAALSGDLIKQIDHTTLDASGLTIELVRASVTSRSFRYRRIRSLDPCPAAAPGRLLVDDLPVAAGAAADLAPDRPLTGTRAVACAPA